MMVRGQVVLISPHYSRLAEPDLVIRAHGETRTAVISNAEGRASPGLLIVTPHLQTADG